MNATSREPENAIDVQLCAAPVRLVVVKDTKGVSQFQFTPNSVGVILTTTDHSAGAAQLTAQEARELANALLLLADQSG